MKCKKDYTVYPLIVYSDFGTQVAVGRYCDKYGNNECYRIYYNGRYIGKEYTKIKEASGYVKETADRWRSDRIWYSFEHDVPYTGEKWKPELILWKLRGGPLPGYYVRNELLR